MTVLLTLGEMTCEHAKRIMFLASTLWPDATCEPSPVGLQIVTTTAAPGVRPVQPPAPSLTRPASPPARPEPTPPPQSGLGHVGIGLGVLRPNIHDRSGPWGTPPPRTSQAAIVRANHWRRPTRRHHTRGLAATPPGSRSSGRLSAIDA